MVENGDTMYRLVLLENRFGSRSHRRLVPVVLFLLAGSKLASPHELLNFRYYYSTEFLTKKSTLTQEIVTE
jgi:hypothetical protein